MKDYIEERAISIVHDIIGHNANVRQIPKDTILMLLLAARVVQ